MPQLIGIAIIIAIFYYLAKAYDTAVAYLQSIPPEYFNITGEILFLLVSLYLLKQLFPLYKSIVSPIPVQIDDTQARIAKIRSIERKQK